MNTTRIQVPVALPEPHFDDEATIATARQVVPIERARTTEFWRKLRTMLPILLAATLCGGLGAAAVNYYEYRHISPAAPEQNQVSLTVQPRAESSPVAIAASSDVAGGERGDGAIVDDLRDSSAQTGDSTTKTEAEAQPVRRIPDVSESAASKAEKKKINSDAAKLTRKRRVNPPDEESPVKRTGAGRIVEVFTGPNP